MRSHGVWMSWCVLVAVFGLASCAQTYYWSRSQAVLPTGAESHKDNVAILDLTELRLSIQAQNYRLDWIRVDPPFVRERGPSRPDAYLPIWVELDAGNRELQFEAARTWLVNAAGDTLHAIGYWGPGVGSWGRELPGCLCGTPVADSPVDFSKAFDKRLVDYDDCFNCRGWPKDTLNAFSGPIDVKQPTCFVLHFDVAAGFEFTLHIGGIDARGRAVKVPPIRFVKGVYRHTQWPPQP